MSMIPQRVLVTGGAGFLGSHIVERLLRDFPEAVVTVIDSLVTGTRENIAHLKDFRRVEFIEHDLTEPNWLPKYLVAHKRDPFDLVFHFASPASPPIYQKYPVMTYLVNGFVTHHLAQYAVEQRARLVYASTSEVYGDPLVHPQPEGYWGNVNPNGLRSCYDEGKRLGETACGVHVREFGADIRIVRIFNTYGPRMSLIDGRVIPSYALHILRAEPLPVFGDGTQTRSFCYVDDLIEGIFRLTFTEGLQGETVNIGSQGEFTMMELADEFERIVGRTLPRRMLPLPADDPQRRRPDTTKARMLLQWEPRVSLAEGLRRTWEYFQSVEI